ncbi:hypothetical protein V0R48_18650 [Pseudomonas alcaligenes]|uniref:hypothetical protein n=1 Tax=Aquipseudomonas alcaligenes TaxID=43263 RepID=UPI002E7B3775|nr:hypothetical protein [Pseudomonas alcaligenes]MEE1951003.1 hypothetical protein [Pseudomonas alcaligenes]
MAGRKRIDLEMEGTKGNRQRCWEAMRARAGGFTAYEIARAANAHDDVVRCYLQGLIAGQYVEVINAGSKSDAGRFEEQRLRLVRDIGAEAPAVTRDGKESTAGRGNEAMWRTLRMLDQLDARELAAHASAAVPVSLHSSRTFLKWLKRAGYVQVVVPGKGGKPERYRLAPGRNTGPRPPMVQRIGQVFDPNLGAVVFRQELDEVDA